MRGARQGDRETREERRFDPLHFPLRAFQASSFGYGVSVRRERCHYMKQQTDTPLRIPVEGWQMRLPVITDPEAFVVIKGIS
jgi:hypothetical protein